MVRIKDLKRRRNEWLTDSDYSLVMLDAADCVHRISPVWRSDCSSEKAWAVSWVFLDSPFGAPNVSTSLYETKEAAQRWVDTNFCDHFEWFEMEAA